MIQYSVSFTFTFEVSVQTWLSKVRIYEFAAQNALLATCKRENGTSWLTLVQVGFISYPS